MAVTLNASTSTGYIQTADTSGDLAIQSNGTTQFNVTSTGAYGQIKSGTAVTTTSGTSVDFTSIPSWVKRITVMLSNVSTAASNANALVRIGYTGAVESTGYNCNYIQTNGSSTFALANITNGLNLGFISNAANNMVAVGTLTLVGSNIWTYSANCVENAATRAFITTGSITLSGTLNILSVVLTSSTFDAGTINILYEG